MALTEIKEIVELPDSDGHGKDADSLKNGHAHDVGGH